MNSTIQTIKNHRSIRSYLDKKIPEDVLASILETVQYMPNSINGQQRSLIIVQNKETKTKLAQLCNQQPWITEAPVFIIFAIDFYKTNLAAELHKRQQVIHESVEGALVGTFDCGIALGATVIAAESLGLGTVPIGSLRKDATAVIELLELPKYTYPVCGLCLGYAKDTPMQKPRLALDTFIHHEKYNASTLVEDIKIYDQTMADYLTTIGREMELNWSNRTAEMYQRVYFPAVKESMAKQGFLFDK